MIKSFLEEFREKIINKKSVVEIVLFLETLDESQKDIILRLMISDYYKINIFNNIYNKSNYYIIKSLEDVKYNVELLRDVIINSKNYSNLDFISKHNIIEELENFNKNKYIENISNTYVIEQAIYKIDYTLKSFKEYYIDYISKNLDDPLRRNSASNFITKKIHELKYIDNDLYTKYILEILVVYYKWKLFIKDHDGEKLLFKEDLLYIKRIKNKSIKRIFIDLNKNYEFLNTLIGEYLHYTTSNTKIDEKIVDNYLKENSTKTFQKKLKIDI